MVFIDLIGIAMTESSTTTWCIVSPCLSSSGNEHRTAAHELRVECFEGERRDPADRVTRPETDVLHLQATANGMVVTTESPSSPQLRVTSRSAGGKLGHCAKWN